MRLMDLSAQRCYPARVTCGFLVSKGCCTYVTCLRKACECSLGIKWVLWDSNLRREKRGTHYKRKYGQVAPTRIWYSNFEPVYLSPVVSICHLHPFPLLQPHDYMKTINVSCRPAPNQLLAYDSHYLHLSQRVSGAQLGLHRQEGRVLVVGVWGGGSALLDQFCRLLYWLGQTQSNGCSSVPGLVRVC